MEMCKTMQLKRYKHKVMDMKKKHQLSEHDRLLE